jgi:NADH-ubiquinone oxidoreductase chain 4L
MVLLKPELKFKSLLRWKKKKWKAENVFKKKKKQWNEKMIISYIIFIIGLIGFILNRRNIIILYIAIEIMLVGCTLNIILSSVNFDDVIGLIWTIIILIIAGIESAIGLSILVLYYRIKGNINIDE